MLTAVLQPFFLCLNKQNFFRCQAKEAIPPCSTLSRIGQSAEPKQQYLISQPQKNLQLCV